MEYYRARGDCYTKMGDLHEALSNYEKAAEKDWRVPLFEVHNRGLILLNVVLIESGKLEEASKGQK
jgi:tetratricopeptide (TPR) repeat protein